MTFSTSDWIAISAVAATIIAALIAWFVSAWSTRKTLATQTLGYRMSFSPLLTMNKVPGGNESLKIEFNGEQLIEPMLLSVDIVNLGNRAVERPPIIIEALGATYVIPIYIAEAPLGYDELWKLERIDADKCAIHLDHINPGQVVKARFFLDERPNRMIVFKCPMKDVKITEIQSLNMGPITSAFLDVISPVASSALKALLK